MHYGKSIDINAPSEIVWRIWSDVEHWSDWTASISSIELLTSGPFAVGSRARIRQPGLPRAVWQVTEFDRGRAFVWVSKSPGARVTGTHRIESHPGGTRAVLGIRFEGPVALAVGWLTRSLTQRYLGMEAEGLKARSEALAAEARKL